VAPVPPREVRKQIPLAPDTLSRIAQAKRHAAERVNHAIVGLRGDLKDFFPTIQTPLSHTARGRLRNPSGRPAGGVLVEALPPVYGPSEGVGEVPWPNPAVYTDARGAFTLELPGVPAPAAGLVLRVRGEGATVRLSVRRIDLITGNLGLLDLPGEVPPAATEGLVTRLFDALPPPSSSSPPPSPPTPVPTLTLGSGDCIHSFQTNAGVIDRFSYSTFIRLVEPVIGERELILRFRRGQKAFAFGDLFGAFDIRDFADFDDLFSFFVEIGDFTLADRKPVARPISVHGFQDAVILTPLEAVKAGSLGLGYVVKMRQTWVPTGMSLGDLLYSLTLAPGEEQRIAVREQRQSFEVSESETFDIEEEQELREAIDSSADAIFRSSLDEVAHGETKSSGGGSSFGIGAAGGLVGLAGGILFGGGLAAGYGRSSSSGTSESEQRLTRDFVSSASEEFHSRLSRNAAARRRAARTGVRLATATDAEVHTTKIIANRNKCHALTIQYWEVLRHFDVLSEVDDVQLVCLVPLELIDFVPPGAPLELPDSAQPPDRAHLCERYARLIQYAPVIARFMPRRPELETGLRALSRLSGDPRLTFEGKDGSQEDVADVSVTGTFLPSERVSVTVVTRGETRLGPFRCQASGFLDLDIETPNAESALVDAIRSYRSANEVGVTMRTAIPLPAHLARNQVARFEFSREPVPFRFLNILISASTIERDAGPPQVWDVKADLQPSGQGGTYVSAFPGATSRVPMALVLAVGANRLPPVFTYTDLLHVEALFQHVARNTVLYSKAVWMSLTPEERVILLEPYTLGPVVPGSPGALDEVPLLNCVTNQLLGFFGNSIILPFHIPPNDEGLTTGQIQDALLTFHRQGGAASRSALTLPTHGVLAEAILGRCNACEKIDLTRFWNWKDSPITPADQPPPLPGAVLGEETATAPSKLVPEGDVTLIQGLTGAAPTSGLAAALVAAKEPIVTTDFTGRAELEGVIANTADQAAAAQKAVVDAATGFGSKVIAALPNVLASEKAIEDEKKKNKEDEASKAKAARAAKVSDTIANARVLAALVGQETDDAKRDTKAAEVATKIVDIDQLTDLQKAQLLQAFTPKPSDSAQISAGKTALAKAMKLLATP